MSVDFPAPLRPMIPTISPRLTSNDTPSVAGVAPKRLLTLTRRSTVSRSAGSRLAETTERSPSVI